MIPYVELAGHTEFSVGHSAGRLKDHVARAEELGQPAVCLTERNSMRQIYDLYKNTVKAKRAIRPIYGVELGVVLDHRIKTLDEATLERLKAENKKSMLKRAIAREERKQGLDRVWTIRLRADTDEGLKNLFRLVSRAWVDGGKPRADKTIQPRVDLEMLAQYAEGVSVSAGGPEGIVTESFLRGETDEAIHGLGQLMDIYGDRFALEIHPHAGALHKKVNLAVEKMSRMGVPVVAVNDVRYILPDDIDAHSVILCLQSKRHGTFEDPEHPRSQPGYHLRTGEEMLGAFLVHHPGLPKAWVEEAVRRTVEVADRARAELHVDPLRVSLPQIVEDPVKEVRKLCMKGWKWRKIEERAERHDIAVERYLEQLKKELRVIGERKLEGYFLIVRDVVNWCREQRIMVGPGRGSAAGSLVSYLLGITSIDPLEHNLMFDRFLAPGRNDMPDIDTDFMKSRRAEVIAYINAKYGEGKVVQIATHNAMHGKSVLKDVTRVLGVPFGDVNAITKTFSNRQGDEKLAVRAVLDTSESGRKFAEQYADALDMVDRLEGSVRQVGVHAAGVVISPVPVEEICPVELQKPKGEKGPVPMTALDMEAVSDVGLLKLDILGIKNLDILDDARRAIFERYHIDVDFEALTFDDQKVIDAFTRQEFVGVFQYDQQSARNVCEGLVFKGFGDVAALTALNRPGCTRSGLTETFRRRRKDPSKIIPLHPIYDAITEDTLGVLVYQEQVVRLLRELASFTPEDADKVRKAIGKKLGEAEIEKYRTQIVTGCVANGLPEADAQIIVDNLLSFAQYSFNRAHSASYAAIAYWEMWCKVYYPAEFIWALMRHAESAEEALGFVAEAKRLGVAILPPEINESGESWTLVPSGIRAGLGAIKNVGKTAKQAIVKGQPFVSLSDFLTRIPGRSATSKVIDSLIRSGAMGKLVPNTKYALENMSQWHGLAKKKKDGWQTLVDGMMEASAALPDYPEVELLALAMEVSPQSTGRHPMELYEELLSPKGALGGVRWLSFDPLFWHNKGGFIAGVLTSVKFRAVGDFDSGADLTAEEKERKGWGRRYAMVQIENPTGSHRVKIEPDVFDAFRELLERGKGCVGMHVDILRSHGSIRANYLCDLEVVRQKTKLGIPLSSWERCFTSQHPVLEFSKKSLRERKTGVHEIIALVTQVKRVTTKHGDEMAFFGLQDGRGSYIEGLAFPELWDANADLIKPGSILEMEVKLEMSKKKQSAILGDQGVTRVFGQLSPNGLVLR